jgi:hypothetical protein
MDQVAMEQSSAIGSSPSQARIGPIGRHLFGMPARRPTSLHSDPDERKPHVDRQRRGGGRLPGQRYTDASFNSITLPSNATSYRDVVCSTTSTDM